ncbi:MAG: CoA-transferase subunit beta [Candidatus Jordarchaeum sp.]|uniref:CoA-transferase subunit beta n=1 Tax=Candidatus Jordarchaeum sp. TaxID=2823881 RepID=UPI00404B60FA
MKYAEDYTIDEIMIVAMAREIKDNDLIFQGITTPLAGAAIMLARETHARNASHLYFLGVNPVMHDISQVMIKPENFLGKVYGLLGINEFWNRQQRGGIDLMFLRPAQIDKWGNANMTLIGDKVKPTIRFSGGVGTADMLVLAQRIVYYAPHHEKKVFVKKIDYITGAGHLENGEWRKKMNIRSQGPTKVISNLAIMNFETENKQMKLESVHPGISIEEVIENTGFELVIPDKVPETEPPIETELKLIREKIDPNNFRKIEMPKHKEAMIEKLTNLQKNLE